jgi:hypothetical protein
MSQPRGVENRTILDMIIYGRPNRTYAAWRLVIFGGKWQEFFGGIWRAGG